MTKVADLPKSNFDRAFAKMKEGIIFTLDKNKEAIRISLESKGGLKGVSIGLGARIAPKTENTNDLTYETKFRFVPDVITDGVDGEITAQMDAFDTPAAEQATEKKAKSSSEVLGVGAGAPV